MPDAWILIHMHIRFWNQVQKSDSPDGCWLWTGSVSAKGYGETSCYPNGVRIRLAHRVSYFKHYGVNPGSLHVLHKCDTPGCVNPDHLYLGTNDDNVQDKYDRDRNAKGERCANSKLTVEAVREIRRRLANGENKHQLARDFGVRYQTIRAVEIGRTWSHVLLLPGSALCELHSF